MSKNSQCSVDSMDGSCSQKWRQWAPVLVQSAGSCALGAAMHALGSMEQLVKLQSAAHSCGDSAGGLL